MELPHSITEMSYLMCDVNNDEELDRVLTRELEDLVDFFLSHRLRDYYNPEWYSLRGNLQRQAWNLADSFRECMEIDRSSDNPSVKKKESRRCCPQE